MHNFDQLKELAKDAKEKSIVDYFLREFRDQEHQKECARRDVTEGRNSLNQANRTYEEFKEIRNRFLWLMLSQAVTIGLLLGYFIRAKGWLP